MRSNWATDVERNEVLELFWRQKDTLGRRLAPLLAEIRHGRELDQLSRNRLAVIAAASDDETAEAVKVLTEFADQQRPLEGPLAKVREWCFDVMIQRMGREPLPQRDWTVGAVGLARQFEGPGAKRFLERVTGKAD